MTEHVRRLIDELIDREGGFVDHPSDKGGPTKYGITWSVARAYGYQGDMKDMPRETAEMIYKAQYWHDPKFAVIATMSAPVAEELFDTGVNLGTGRAAMFLQRALNTLNLRGKLYADLAVDGRIGAMTRHALKTILAYRGPQAATRVLLRLLDGQQVVAYMELAEKKETQEDFMFGWVDHRIENVKR